MDNNWRVIRFVAIAIMAFSPVMVVGGYLIEMSLIDSGVPFEMIPNYMIGSFYGMIFGIFFGSWILQISEDMEEDEKRMIEMSAPITFL